MSDILPDDFQMTELGPLPREWRVVRLGEMFDILQGKSLSAKQNKGLRSRPFLRTSNVYWGYLDLSKLDVMDFTEEEERKFALQPGDLLVCEGGDVGRTAMWEGQMQGVYYQNHLHRLRARDNNVNPMFVMYWLQTAFTMFNLYSGSSNKTTIPNLSQGRLAVFLIPLPPLPEQRAIAHVLRTVQRAKEATDGVIAALKELKKSLMQHLFTYGPVPVGAKNVSPQRETEIGPIPAHWRVVRLGEVVEKTKQIDPYKKPEWSFRYVDVSSVDNELLRITAYQNFIGKEAPSRARKQIVAGDVLFATVRPYLKRIAIVPSELDGHICSTAFCVLRAKSEINSCYLFFAVSHEPFVQRVAEHQRGSSYPAVTDHDVLREVIPLPPLSEQREIARMLQAVDAKIAAEQARRAALEDLFKTLLHQLMTGKIRVPDIVGARRRRAPTTFPNPED